MARKKGKTLSPVENFFENELPARFREIKEKLTPEQKGVEVILAFQLSGEGGGEYEVEYSKGDLSIRKGISGKADMTYIQPWEYWWKGMQGEAGLLDPSMRAISQDFTRLSPLLAKRVKEIRGTIRFEIYEGEKICWWVVIKFSPQAGDTPQTTVRLDEETARTLREGKLTHQQAFMAGKIRIEGDMNLALQVGSLSMIR